MVTPTSETSLGRAAPQATRTAHAPEASRHGPLRQAADVTVQVALFATAVGVYFGVRGLTEGQWDVALGNAAQVVDLERTLHLNHEQVLQQAVIGNHAVTRVLNWIYIFGHWPVIITVMTWLLLRHRAVFRRARDAMFASGLVGMVVFATFPVAPPRLDGLVDTVTNYSSAYRVLQPPVFTNQYAAMPSLHVGWDLVIGLSVWTAASRLWVRIAGLAMPVLMTLAVVLTANHYLLDTLAGAALAGGAWLVLGRRTGP
jgi:membrane-associated phospholipid phosphatase